MHTVDQERSRQVEPVVIAAGRLVPQKGFDLLIEAWAQVVPEHPEWRLRIFGSGPRQGRLAGLVEQHGPGGHVALPVRTDRLEKELTDGVDGVLVPPRDVDAPAAALKRVIPPRPVHDRKIHEKIYLSDFPVLSGIPVALSRHYVPFVKPTPNRAAIWFPCVSGKPA
ncbi:glycosyltransferase [Nonomuraea sp. NPDC050643]|uniref:glycosyltransferase n=1 Tax=Nonomuraea sp. NPDC050643 TaxID=3155660 RepID=UPI0033F749A8